ncbi:MAG: calcium-binding protein [Pseudomonadota bacterium]
MMRKINDAILIIAISSVFLSSTACSNDYDGNPLNEPVESNAQFIENGFADGIPLDDPSVENYPPFSRELIDEAISQAGVSIPQYEGLSINPDGTVVRSVVVEGSGKEPPSSVIDPDVFGSIYDDDIWIGNIYVRLCIWWIGVCLWVKSPYLGVCVKNQTENEMYLIDEPEWGDYDSLVQINIYGYEGDDRIRPNYSNTIKGCKSGLGIGRYDAGFNWGAWNKFWYHYYLRVDGGAGNDLIVGTPFTKALEKKNIGVENYDCWFNYNNIINEIYEVLDGGDDNDIIYGCGGDDIVYGGNGEDNLYGDYIIASSYFNPACPIYRWPDFDFWYHPLLLYYDDTNPYQYEYKVFWRGADWVHGGDGGDRVRLGPGRENVEDQCAEGCYWQCGVGGKGGYPGAGERADNIQGSLYGHLNGGADILYAADVNFSHGIVVFHDIPGDNNLLSSGDGPDRLYGDEGIDTMYAGEDADEDIVCGYNGIDRIDNMGATGPGGDWLIGGGMQDFITGSDFTDFIIGGLGGDEISAKGGDDSICHGGFWPDTGTNHIECGLGDDDYSYKEGDIVNPDDCENPVDPSDVFCELEVVKCPVWY